MGVFSTRGSLPQPLPAYWMSPLADRLTCCSRKDLSNLFQPQGTVVACNNIGQFLYTNASLGAFTLAPDGTLTGQKLVEDNTNNPHYATGVACEHWDAVRPLMRVAGIFKAGERTRVALEVIPPGGWSTSTVGFDLAGGRIAYGPTDTSPFGGICHGFNPTIASLGSFGGGGWFLCYFDHLIDNVSNFSGFEVRILIDNGSGLAAQSTSFAGDGASGIFAWRQSVLPARAWSLQTQTFFDDFNDPTLSNFDLLNVKDPTKKWFITADWPHWEFYATVSGLSATNSVLRIPATTPGGGQGLSGAQGAAITNSVPTGPDQYIEGFRLNHKMYYEFKYRWNRGREQFDSANSDLTVWMHSTQWVSNFTNPNGQNYQMNGIEIDIAENISTSYVPGAGGFFWQPSPPNIGGDNVQRPVNGVLVGVQVYHGCWLFESYTQAIDSAVFYPPLNQFYKINTPSNPPLPTPPTGWTVYNYQTDIIGNRQPNVFYDVDNTFHVIGALLLDYDRPTKDYGCVVYFNDGVFCGGNSFAPFGNQVYRQSDNGPTPYQHNVDWQSLTGIFAAGAVTGSGYDIFIDYVRVTQ